MEEYLLFCDETKKTNGNDNFIFGGFAVSKKIYIQQIIPQINELKKKHFGDTDVVFHYTEMKNNRNKFSIFTDAQKRNDFYEEFRALINSFDITTFVIYYNQDIMQELYKKKSDGHYNIGFIKILENYLHFLVEKDGYGSIVIESRSLKENAILLDSFYEYKSSGSVCFNNNIIKKHISSLGFTIKEDNCIGLQIADFIPASFSRLINEKSDKQLLGRTFKQKLYKNSTQFEPILGLRNIL